MAAACDIRQHVVENLALNAVTGGSRFDNFLAMRLLPTHSTGSRERLALEENAEFFCFAVNQTTRLSADARTGFIAFAFLDDPAIAPRIITAASPT